MADRPSEIVIPDGSRETLAAAVRRLLDTSHRRAKSLIAGGAVLVDGAIETDPARRPEPGSRVVVDPDRRRTPRAPLEGPGFRVVHLDRDVIVVDKQAGVLTIPTGPADEPGDVALVARVASALRLAGHRVRSLWVVHRIDRETSGLVAIARGERAASALREQFRRRSPRREYLAWCARAPDPPRGELADRLLEDPGGGPVRIAAAGGDGREARLRYVVEASSARGARVRVTLDTGRRNQIRVQLAARGWPLVGDTWYGAGEVPPGRAALHAARLRFAHPRTDRPIEARARPPADLLALDRSLFDDPDDRVRVG